MSITSIAKGPPSAFLCSSSKQVMDDPVLTLCGHLFERTVAQNLSFCPKDGQFIRHLIPCSALKNRITSWKTHSEKIVPRKFVADEKNADMLFSTGDIRRALTIYQQILTSNQESNSKPQNISLMNKIGKCLRELGEFDKALTYHEYILELEGGSEEQTLNVALTLNYIGICFQNLCLFEKALEMHKKSLHIKQLLPEASHLIPSSLNNIGNCQRLLGNLPRASTYYSWAFTGEQKLHGEYHIKTARSLNNLGNCLLRMGKFQDALEKYQQVLSIRNNAKAHFEIPRSLNNIGLCLRYLGKFQKSLSFHRKALQKATQMYGNEHVDIAYSLNSIGKCFDKLGHFQEALKYYEQALDIRRKTSGEEHIDLVFFLKDIGICFTNLGKAQKALEKHLEAAKIEEKIFENNSKVYPKDSPLFAECIKNKGECLRQLGKYHKAIELQEQALQINEKVFGEYHPDIASSLDAIGACAYSLGQFQQAYTYYARSHAIKTYIYGKDHYETALSLTEMANALSSIGEDVEKARALHVQALSIKKQIFDAQHPSIAISLVGIASCDSFLQKQQKSLQSYQEALDIRKKSLGPDHPDTILTSQCVSNCASLLLGKSNAIIDQIDPLQKEDFYELITFADQYLNSLEYKDLRFAKNPTGFLRLHLPIPSHLSNKIESIRLNYWPRDFKIDVVEAQHTHPRYFESMILNEGYTHAVFQEEMATIPSSSYRAHRMFKNTENERNIFFMGRSNLIHLKNETFKAKDLIRFPRHVIHQVTYAQPGTLSLNCVFKSSDYYFFDIYVLDGSLVDPQTEREVLMPDQAASIGEEIHTILNTFLLKSREKERDNL